ncbi:unnamed protein product, partial [Laminaria digitata]
PPVFSVYTCSEPSVPFSSPVNSTAPAAVTEAAAPVNGSGAATAAGAGAGAITSNSTENSDASASVSGDTGDASDPLPARPTILSVGPEVASAGGALVLVGEGFGEDVADVRVMVGGRDCRDPELCHRVCRPCGEDDRCDFDEMCMEDNLSKGKVCVPICDGTEGSCPCDHLCLPKRFELQGEPHTTEVYLCRPPDAGECSDPNFLCHGSLLREQERVQCTVPVLVWDQAETQASSRAGGRKKRRGGGGGTSGSGGGGGRGGRGGGGGGGEGGGGRRRVEGDGDGDEGGGEGKGGGGGGGRDDDVVMMASVSLTVGDRAAVWGDGVAYAPRRCRSGGECDDGDACSVDACVE